MTDQELLLAAAKAAGYAVSPTGRTDGAFIVLTNDDGDFIWNPLNDDGDALRLAVYLDLGIEVHQALAVVNAGNGEQDIQSVSWNLRDIPDAYTATRRAIVQAAAALMPEAGAS